VVNNTDITQSLNLTIPLVVVGNLTIPNSDSTLIINYNGQPVLNVSGVATLDGTLILVASQQQSVGSRLVIGYTPDLQHSFNSVLLQSTNPCTQYKVSSPSYQSSDSSFGVLVESSSDTCKSPGVHWWVYLIAVVGALLLIAMMVGTGLYLQRKGYCRRLFRRMKARRTPIDNSPM